MSSKDPPLRQSKQELHAAQLALQGMRAATNLEEFAIWFRGFLDRIEKVWVKAERECQPSLAQFEPWQRVFKKLRRDDQLLMYLRQARNADQHSIQHMTQELLGQLVLVIPPLGTVEVQIDETRQQLTVKGECQIAVQRGRSYRLLPINNRGRVFDPPSQHLGENLPKNDALLVAEKGTAFYEDFLAQAEAKFFSAAAAPYPYTQQAVSCW